MELSKTKLSSLKKEDLITIILELKEEKNQLKEINEKLDAINGKFESLQSELAIAKQVNVLLVDRVVALERNCAANEQYSRRECLEIAGIPETVSHADLENKVRQIFDNIDVSIPTTRIKACHCIGDKGRTIVKLSHRKDADVVFKNKKKLADVEMLALGFPQGSKDLHKRKFMYFISQPLVESEAFVEKTKKILISGQSMELSKSGQRNMAMSQRFRISMT